MIPAAAFSAVRTLEGVASAALSSKDGAQELVVVSPMPRAILPQLIRALMDSGAVLEQIAPTEVTLEDVFIAHLDSKYRLDWRKCQRLWTSARSFQDSFSSLAKTMGGFRSRTVFWPKGRRAR